MKILLISLILCLSFLLFPLHPVFAESSYVLPYPSLMPGNKFYKIKALIDHLATYWYFGNFGQFTYNLKQSDKYLVEAKTLFEYKQYLLASESLQTSNKYFAKVAPYLDNAKKEKKDISTKQDILKEASRKHVEILHISKTLTPTTFMWKPEKTTPTILRLHKIINESIRIRQNIP